MKFSPKIFDGFIAQETLTLQSLKVSEGFLKSGEIVFAPMHVG